jgi:nitronate monooxygenase
MLDIKYPIIEGAFGGFGTSALAVAVSEAGGLGMITAGAFRTAEELLQDIRRAKSLTDKPLGVNLTAMVPGLEEMREVAIEEGIPVVETAAYRADVHGKRLKEAGVKWIHKVATMKHALAAERQGADAVVIVGLEGAGFKSVVQLPTLIAIPWAARQLGIPVIGAGGVGDGRGFMATLAMGAEAVYMGTAFMATQECPIPDKYKRLLVEGDPTDPKFRDRNLLPPRMEEYEKVLKERATTEEGEWLLKLERVLLKEGADLPEGGLWGMDFDEVFRMAPGSLAVAVLDRIVTVKELIDGIIDEAESIRSRWVLGG